MNTGWNGDGNGDKNKNTSGDGNRDEDRNQDGDGAGVRTKTGVETPRQTQNGSGDGSGDANKTNNEDGKVNEDEKGNGNENRIGKGGGEAKKRKKSHKTYGRPVGTWRNFGGKMKERRKESVGPVASIPGNLENNKEARAGAKGTQALSKKCTSRGSASPLSRLIRDFRNKYH